MKQLFATLGVLAILAIPTQGFAWTYEGPMYLNKQFEPFGQLINYPLNADTKQVFKVGSIKNQTV